MSEKDNNQLPTNARGVRETLNARGWASLAAWARSRDIDPDASYKALKRWGNRSDRTPIGIQTAQILAQLRTDLYGSREDCDS